jgi:uncharacterized UBP type Zn finger protein
MPQTQISKCSHIEQITVAQATSETCQECEREGTKPVALRVCLSCGHVGCCDSSIGQHARKHYQDTKHPVMQSFKSAPAGQSEWRWCYIDNAYVE